MMMRTFNRDEVRYDHVLTRKIFQSGRTFIQSLDDYLRDAPQDTVAPSQNVLSMIGMHDKFFWRFL